MRNGLARCVAVATLGSLLVTACSSAHHAAPSPSVRAPTATGAFPPLTLPARVLARIPTGPPVLGAYGHGSLWFTGGHAGGYGEPVDLYRLDPVTNKVIADVKIGPYPSGLAVDDAGIWVTNGGSDKGVTPPFPLGDSIFRIDPMTNRIAAKINLAAGPIAGGFGSLWAYTYKSGNQRAYALGRIDETSNRVVASITVPPLADVKVGAHAVWLLTGAGHLLKVDPASMKIVADARVGPSDETNENLAVGNNWVFVGTGTGTDAPGQGVVVIVDQDTARVISSPVAIPYPTAMTFVNDSSLSNNQGGRLWTLNSGTLTAIDPRTRTVVGKVPVGQTSDRWVAYGARSLWVDVGTANATGFAYEILHIGQG